MKRVGAGVMVSNGLVVNRAGRIQLLMRRPRRFGDIAFQGQKIAGQDARAGDQNIVMARAA